MTLQLSLGCICDYRIHHYDTTAIFGLYLWLSHSPLGHYSCYWTVCVVITFTTTAIAGFHIYCIHHYKKHYSFCLSALLHPPLHYSYYWAIHAVILTAYKPSNTLFWLREVINYCSWAGAVMFSSDLYRVGPPVPMPGRIIYINCHSPDLRGFLIILAVKLTRIAWFSAISPSILNRLSSNFAKAIFYSNPNSPANLVKI